MMLLKKSRTFITTVVISTICLVMNQCDSHAQTQKSAPDTSFLNLSAGCKIENSYVLKVKNFLVYIPDTTYENYSIDYCNKTNAFRMKKGMITPYSSMGRALLTNLMIERSQYCCVYNKEKGTWLNKLIIIHKGECPTYHKMVFGETQILIHIVVCRKKTDKRK
jgi:hypothetical protein